jgi:hypothetical protein
MTRDAETKGDPKAGRLFDKRTIERNIKKGLLSRKDYDKHLKALNDVGDKGVYGAAEGQEPPSGGQGGGTGAGPSEPAEGGDADGGPLGPSNNQY